MPVPFLKKFRLLFASLFFLLLAVSFLDFRYILPESWFTVILYIQFTPSFLKFMDTPALLATGFIVVIALTVFT
ncbi:MAG: hypothetical protein K8R35_05740, partial [Bacteroidales bacterium]|nr:hypothetical protein [Bacteroidales bacterium]